MQRTNMKWGAVAAVLILASLLSCAYNNGAQAGTAGATFVVR